VWKKARGERKLPGAALTARFRKRGKRGVSRKEKNSNVQKEVRKVDPGLFVSVHELGSMGKLREDRKLYRNSKDWVSIIGQGKSRLSFP